MSIVSMQLIEFFLWRNISNPSANYFWSIAGVFLLTLQPIASTLLIENKPLRNKLLLSYGSAATLYMIYMLMNKNFQTTVSVDGHLRWNWAYQTNIVLVMSVYMVFLYVQLIITKNVLGLVFTLTLFVSYYYFYYRDGSAGSMWCWSINGMMIYFIAKLLFYLPYREKLGLC